MTGSVRIARLKWDREWRRGVCPPICWGGGFPTRASTTIVLILLINTGLYVATAIHSSRAGGGTGLDIDAATLFDFGAKYRAAIMAGQWWRLITAGFLHGGVLHILMNSWVLFDVGAQVEESFGTSRFLLIDCTWLRTSPDSWQARIGRRRCPSEPPARFLD